MEAKKLSLDLIRLDGETQSREALDQEAIAEYTAVWEAAEPAENPFPAIIVFHDGSDYWPADGFHRIISARDAKRASILAEVKEGSARAAFLFGLKSNRQHGVRRSNADKRYAVRRLLEDQEWGKKSQRWIADEAGVSRVLVKEINERLKKESGGRKATSTGEDREDVGPESESGGFSATSTGEDREAGESSQSDRVVGKDGKSYPAGSAEEEFPEDETLEQMCQREASEIESWARKISALLKDAQKALEDVPTLDELNARTGWERKLKEALATLRGSKPMVCPMCDGDDKRCACKGRGRVTRQQYKQMV